MIELLTAHPELRDTLSRIIDDYKVKYEELLKTNGLSATG